MIGNSKKMLQNLQETYSENLKMTLYMTDKQGNPMTTMSGITPFTELLVCKTKVPFLNQLKDIINQYSANTASFSFTPISHPAFSGVKAFLCPIILHGKVRSYIWAWSFIEEGLLEYLKAEIYFLENPDWQNRVLSLEVLPPEKVKEKRVQLTNMANICAELLKNEKELEEIQEIEQMIEVFKTTNHIPYYKLVELWKRNKNFEYIGVASVKDDIITLKYYLGPKDDQFVGSSFEKDGTIFEEVIKSKGLEYLEYIGFEPRLSFLMKNGIKTDSFFCYPILINDKVSAVIFGGNGNVKSFDLSTLSSLRILGSIIELSMKHEWVKTSLDLHLMKLSILADIGRSMMISDSLKEIIEQIADIVNSLVPTHFSAVISGTGEYQIVNVTNKISNAAIEEYCQKMHEQYFNQTENLNDIKNSQINEEYETTILNYPIYLKQTLFAVISASLCQSGDIKEAEAYLYSLAGISSMVLHSYKKELKKEFITTQLNTNEPELSISMIEQLTAREQDVLKLIIKGMSNKEIGDRLFISPHTVKNHITNIFSKLGVNDRTEIITSFYESTYLYAQTDIFPKN